MNIRHIQLENIKCFSSFSTSFAPGINVILGQNGTGKTTIVESIGLCLFGAGADSGYMDYFLRHGSKSGQISVTFIHAEETYTIVKSMKRNGSTSRRVYDANHLELSLHGERDVDEFISQLLGLQEQYTLSRIFLEMIGVRQGAFTQPFFNPPSQRKQQFNTMLGVDQYKKAAQRIPALLNHIRDRLHQLDIKIQVNRSHTADLTDCKEAYASLLDTLTQKRQLQEETQMARKKADAAYAAIQEQLEARNALRLTLSQERNRIAYAM